MRCMLEYLHCSGRHDCEQLSEELGLQKTAVLGPKTGRRRMPEKAQFDSMMLLCNEVKVGLQEM